MHVYTVANIYNVINTITNNQYTAVSIWFNTNNHCTTVLI